MPLAPEEQVGRAVPAVTSPACPRTGPQVTLAPPPEVAAPARPHPAGQPAPAAGMGIPRDAPSLGAPGRASIPAGRSLGAGTRADCGTEPRTEPSGPTRGDGGTSSTGLRQQLGWAPGCPCPAGSASRKEGGGIPWAAPGCLCPGGGRRRGQRDTLCPPFPALRATLSRRLRAIKGHTEGFSAASRSSRSPQLPQPGASPRAGREAEAGTPIPGCGSFGRRPNARAVSDSRCAAPRAAMLRTAAGAGSGDTEVRTP